MQAVSGRYNIKLQFDDGSVGYGMFEIPGDYPSVEAALSNYRGRKGFKPVEIAAKPFPWEPPATQAQQDYAQVATGVISSGDLSADNLSKIAQRQPPGMSPQVEGSGVTAKENVFQAQPVDALTQALSAPQASTAATPIATYAPPPLSPDEGLRAAQQPSKRYYKSTWAKNDPSEPDHLHGSGAFDVDHELTPDEVADYRRRGIDVTPIDQATAGQMNAAYRQQINTPSPIVDNYQPPVAQPRTLDSGGSHLANALHNGTLQLAPANPSTLTSPVIGEQVSTTSGQPAGGRSDPGGEGTLTVRMPNGEMKNHVGISEALNQDLQAGGVPLDAQGQPMQVDQFQGGWIVRGQDGNWSTLNPLFGQQMTSAQVQALSGAGLSVAGIPTGGSTGNTGGGAGTTGGPGYGAPGGTSGPPPGSAGAGYLGNQGAQAPRLPTDIEKALMELMQEARNQGVRGQEALTGLVDDYKNYLGFARSAAEQTFNRRNQLTDTLLGKITPGIESALGTMNEATGLSPEAMAALRLQATEQPERDYQQQVEQLKTQLAGRGAFGGGAMPGDAGAMIRGYAPLMSARDSTRASLLSNAILANEQRKFDTLGLNRQTALGAMGTGAGLTSSLAGAYNPASLFGANESALGGILNTINSGTASGFQGLNTATGAANVLQEMQPGSFRNTLLASLLSTGGNILTQPGVLNAIGRGLGGLLNIGGNNNNSNTNTNSPGVNTGYGVGGTRTPPYIG